MLASRWGRADRRGCRTGRRADRLRGRGRRRGTATCGRPRAWCTPAWGTARRTRTRALCGASRGNLLVGEHEPERKLSLLRDDAVTEGAQLVAPLDAGHAAHVAFG